MSIIWDSSDCVKKSSKKITRKRNRYISRFRFNRFIVLSPVYGYSKKLVKKLK